LYGAKIAMGAGIVRSATDVLPSATSDYQKFGVSTVVASDPNAASPFSLSSGVAVSSTIPHHPRVAYGGGSNGYRLVPNPGLDLGAPGSVPITALAGSGSSPGALPQQLGSGPSAVAPAVRTTLGSDSTSYVMATTDSIGPMSTVITAGAGGVPFPVESDGKLKASVYGANGANSLQVNGDGALAKVAQLADITSGVVQVLNDTKTPVLCKLVDGSGGSVAITNGLVGTYLADTSSSNPVAVVLAGTTPTLALHVAATTVTEPSDTVFVNMPNTPESKPGGPVTDEGDAKSKS